MYVVDVEEKSLGNVLGRVDVSEVKELF